LPATPSPARQRGDRPRRFRDGAVLSYDPQPMFWASAARWRQAGPHRRSGRERHDHRAGQCDRAGISLAATARRRAGGRPERGPL
jgi:hypothetical protein